MGGINCPPGTIVMDSAAYEDRLAKYCQGLFAGASAFYAGQAAIETAVITNNGLTAPITLIVEARNQLLSAKMPLTAVGAMVGEKAGIGGQLSMLDDAIKALDDVTMELGAIDTGGNTQAAIWRDDAVTTACAKASEAVSAILAWQATFALQSMRATADAETEVLATT